MPKSKPDRAGAFVIITPSEARAEAAYLVLGILLGRLAASERMRIQLSAQIAAEDLRVPSICAEVDALFETNSGSAIVV